MNFEKITVGPFEVNCVIGWNDKNQALVIDPGFDANRISDFLNNKQLRVSAYLLTHGHTDHISALAELHTSHPAPIYVHPADLQWCFGSNNQIEPYYSAPTQPDVEFSKHWKTNGFNFQTLETPGHTPGGVCYWFEDDQVCITGDTLFKGTCGRTDLPNGNASVLNESLKLLAKTLPPETRIIAGHGETTTMAEEFKRNFYLQRIR